jgi:lysophospholipase L1-like esterase
MPPRRSRVKTFLFICLLTVLGSTALIVAAEVVVRIKYSLMHKDAGYLVLGIIGDYRRGIPRDPNAPAGPLPTTTYKPKKPAAPATAPAAAPAGGAPRALPINIPKDHESTVWHECSQRDIRYRINTAGGRGPEWVEQKPAGTIRVVALGESSTFGAGNPEDQTWPALLEKALREKHGLNVEVLNFGVPGQRIAGMLEHLPSVLDKYHPDVVVHYGGYNETWSEFQVPQFLSFLHYRSMLYTYIEEKLYFRAEASAMRLVPDTRGYEKSIRELLAMVRARGARLVVAPQALPAGATPREGTACAEKWRDDTVLAACLNDLISQPDQYSRLVRSRVYRTVVLQRVAADVAAQEQLLVIDVRNLLAERDDSHRLFCDEIHLTDQGNAVLAGAMAGPLADYLARHAGS